jgi:hypothetical protein
MALKIFFYNPDNLNDTIPWSFILPANIVIYPWALDDHGVFGNLARAKYL